MRPQQARMDALAEAASIVARTTLMPASRAYALARDIWALWWETKDAFGIDRHTDRCTFGEHAQCSKTWADNNVQLLHATWFGYGRRDGAAAWLASLRGSDCHAHREEAK